MAKFTMGFGNPNFSSPAFPRLKLPQGTGNAPFTIGQPPAPQSPFGPMGVPGGGAPGGGGMSAAARNAMNLAKKRGTDLKSWMAQLASGQGPFAKLFVDPSAAINAAMPGITEKMTGDFNEGANRLGELRLVGVSNGKMTGGTPIADLYGQAAKSANLAREEIRSKYQFEADKANADRMAELMDKLGIFSGGVSGGGGGGYGGAIRSAASYDGGGGTAGTAGMNQDAARASKGASAQTLMANEPAQLPPVTGGVGGMPLSFGEWSQKAFNVDPRDMTPEALQYAKAKYDEVKSRGPSGLPAPAPRPTAPPPGAYSGRG